MGKGAIVADVPGATLPDVAPATVDAARDEPLRL
jgi:hypothetical protein